MAQTAKLIDGNEMASKITARIKREVELMKIKPGIALLMIGNDLSSEIYVNLKEKDSKEAGFHCERYNLEEKTSEDEIIGIINELNKNPKIHGILVQLPLPRGLNERKILDTIVPEKDVDGCTTTSLGNLFSGKEGLFPAAARGVVSLIESTGARIEGSKAVVVGKSNLVGKPIAFMLLEKDASVSICHIKTPNLSEYTKEADILVVATGKANLITNEMVKQGAIVIDVGINRIEGKIIGDVDMISVREKAGFITPVPGGVGPMTRAMLMENTIKAMQNLERPKGEYH